jgi:hypothetical protein
VTGENQAFCALVLVAVVRCTRILEVLIQNIFWLVESKLMLRVTVGSE